jgi:arylsulfatase
LSEKPAYCDGFIDNAYIALAAPFIMTQFLQAFTEFPPGQKAASFTVD